MAEETRPPRRGVVLYAAYLYYGFNLIVQLVVGCALLAMTWFGGVWIYSGGWKSPLVIYWSGAIFGLGMLLKNSWVTNQRFLRNEAVSSGYYWVLPALGGVLFLMYAVAVPKFDDLTRKMNDDATRGNMGAIRSALAIYYGDMEGLYPESPEALTVREKYMSSVPTANTKAHGRKREFAYFPEIAPMDTGNWGYVNNPYSANMGGLFVDCTHTDTKGNRWHTY